VAVGDVVQGGQVEGGREGRELGPGGGEAVEKKKEGRKNEGGLFCFVTGVCFLSLSLSLIL
jgi:hypothetical protein